MASDIIGKPGQALQGTATPSQEAGLRVLPNDCGEWIIAGKQLDQEDWTECSG